MRMPATVVDSVCRYAGRRHHASTASRLILYRQHSILTVPLQQTGEVGRRTRGPLGLFITYALLIHQFFQ